MNRLKTASSPYLLQHANNPVHWYEWGEEALAAAKSQNKPILLSIGYAACHWCHVMAHESFEDESTAEKMNAHFINIKVDREERPDIDQIYMTALHAMGEQGGWPLTMALMPDGRPFWGGTYYPPMPSYGRPSFTQVLEALANAYRDKPVDLMKNADAISDHLAKLAIAPSETAPPPKGMFQAHARKSLQLYDAENGGVRGTQKFPNAPILENWLRLGLNTAEQPAIDAFIHTVTALSMGGIYDHLGGGISRYTVDDRWLVPHFEKMLYDNAHYLRHLLLAWQITERPLFRTRIDETVGWLRAEMTREGGGFYSSLDADSEGEEGKFYVWDQREVADILGTDTDHFCKAYDITTEGNWEGKSIPNRLHTIDGDPDPHPELKSRLLTARNERVRPATDDKILTDWNGYMIRSLADCGRILSNKAYLDMAISAYRFICESSPDDATLNHSWRDDRTVRGIASDYTSMANAALSLFEATGDDTYLSQAKDWTETLTNRYGDGQGGIVLTERDDSGLIIIPRCDADDPNPSPSSQALEALARLSKLAANVGWHDRATRLSSNIYTAIKASPYGASGYFNALDVFENMKEVSLLNANGASLSQELTKIPITTYCLKQTVGQNAMIAGQNFTAQTDEEVAIICHHQTCSTPITDPAELSARLKP